MCKRANIAMLFLYTLMYLMVFLNAKTLKHTFKVSYITGSPDGVWTNNILGINGQFPGPTIEGHQGDILQITVHNNIQDGQNLSIHWHGIHQRKTPFQDGVGYLTQCPLKKGSTQVYRFHLEEIGSHWYHSHVASQYTEGLWGALIVHPMRNTSQYDSDIVMSLNDWYHTHARENEEYLQSPEAEGAPPYPSSILINGMGRYPCNKAVRQGRLCSRKRQRRPVFHVKTGKYHKIRLINSSGYTAFNFTIEKHVLQIIEADGVDVGPMTTEGIFIGPGQRYAFLIFADPLLSHVNRFLIRANMRKEFIFTIPGQNINKRPEATFVEVTGVLQYVEVLEPQRPRFEIYDYMEPSPNALNWTQLKFFPEFSLKANDGQLAPSYFDKQLVLNISFPTDANGSTRGAFNNIPYKLLPGKPLLARAMEGSIPRTENATYFTRYGDVIQIIINNPMEGAHPIHLHGHHFWVLGLGRGGDGPYNPVKHALRNTGYRRDTLMVKGDSWAAVRFKSDNVGVWNLHCHVDWHYITGMAVIFVEGHELIHKLNIPEEARRVCEDHNVEI